MKTDNENIDKSLNKSPNKSPNENCNESFKPFSFAGMALDPIHVGTGGARLGRVDNTIVSCHRPSSIKRIGCNILHIIGALKIHPDARSVKLKT